MTNQLSVVSAHFSSFNWTETLVSRLIALTPPDRLLEIILINQDRTEESRRRLTALSPLVRVVEYPRSEQHFALIFHDHPVVLEKAMLETRGEIIAIFDSDAHPINSSWLVRSDELLTQYDAICATVTLEQLLTHPCFMLLQKKHLDYQLKFDLDLFEQGIDTGRLIGKQLADHGQRVYLAPPTIAFNGLWGATYLGCIYHHGQGTFAGSPSPTVRGLVVWQQSWFRNIVLNKGRYYLTKRETIVFFIRYAVFTFLPRLRRLNLVVFRGLRGHFTRFAAKRTSSNVHRK